MVEVENTLYVYAHITIMMKNFAMFFPLDHYWIEQILVMQKKRKVVCIIVDAVSTSTNTSTITITRTRRTTFNYIMYDEKER